MGEKGETIFSYLNRFSDSSVKDNYNDKEGMEVEVETGAETETETLFSYFNRIFENNNRGGDFLVDSDKILEQSGIFREVSDRVNQVDPRLHATPEEIGQLVSNVTNNNFKCERNNGKIFSWVKDRYRKNANTLSKVFPNSKVSKHFENWFRDLSDASNWQEYAFKLGKGVINTELGIFKAVMPLTCIVAGATLILVEPSQLGKVAGPILMDMGYSLGDSKKVPSKEMVRKVVSSLEKL